MKRLSLLIALAIGTVASAQDNGKDAEIAELRRQLRAADAKLKALENLRHTAGRAREAPQHQDLVAPRQPRLETRTYRLRSSQPFPYHYYIQPSHGPAVGWLNQRNHIWYLQRPQPYPYYYRHYRW